MSVKPRIPSKAWNSREAWLLSLKVRGHSVEQGRFLDKDSRCSAFTYIESPESKSIVLIVHGTGNDHLFGFQSLIEELLESAHDILSFDLPGHGAESSTVLNKESFWSSGFDLQGFLDSRGFAMKKLFVIAYSLGALWVLNAIKEKQLHSEKLVLLAVPRRIRLSAVFLWQEFCTLFSSSFLRQWKTYGWRETVPAFGNFRREDFPIRLDSNCQVSYPEFVDQLFAERSPLDLIRELSQKCLVITGSDDKIALASEQSLWQRANPQLTFLVIDRANHFLLPFQKPTIDAIRHWMNA